MAINKLVIVKHWQDNGKYLFLVPPMVDLKAGNQVICNTSRGNDQPGQCCCDSFEVADDMVESICKLFGTQASQLRSVTGQMALIRFSGGEVWTNDSEDR